MTGLRKWRRPSLAIFFIYIVYLLSFVFRVFLFSVSNQLLFCFYLGFLLIFQCWGFREGLRMILPQARNHISRRNVNDVIQLAWFQFAKEGMTRKGNKRSCQLIVSENLQIITFYLHSHYRSFFNSKREQDRRLSEPRCRRINSL